MAYTDLEGREALMARLGEAVEYLGEGLGSLGDAYEALDDQTADTLEEKMFGPMQRAYGRGKKAYGAFTGRHGLDARTFDAPASPLMSGKPGELVASAGASAEAADHALAELQDDRAFLAVGDPQLRTDVSEVRQAIAEVPRQAKLMLRTLGR